MDADQKRFSRRQILTGTSTLAVGAFLAACGGTSPTATSAPSARPSAAASAAPASAAPAASAAASTAPAASAAASASARPSTAASAAPASAAASAPASAAASAAAASRPPKPSTPKPEEVILTWGTYQLNTFQLDPQLHVGTIAESQLRHMYEPLVQLDRDGKVVPQLATEWKRLDDLTVQFKLRQNVKFHNGEDFDGEAVKYSIARPLIPENNAGARTTYSGISEVQVVDKYTVNIKTSAPDPALLNRLSGFSMTMVAPKWAAAGGNAIFKTEANGTGPYKLAPGGFTTFDQPLRLVSNEAYWGGAPKIKKVQLRTIIELATRTAALRSGEVHVAKDVSVEEIAAINSSGRALAKVTQSNRIPYYVMESRKPPLDNVKLRQAINYGANIDQIIKSVLYGNGTRVATTVAPWHVGFHPDLKPYPYDPDKAKALMREAGMPNGFDVDINYIQGRYMKDKEVAEAIGQELGKVGIRVKQNLLESAALTQKDNAMELTGMIFASWGNWIFDADNMLYSRWHSSLSKTANAGKGISGAPYQNAEYDKMVESARIELDPAKRLDFYKQAQQKLFDDSVALFMYTLSDVFGVDNWILWEPRRDEMVWAHEMSYNE